MALIDKFINAGFDLHTEVGVVTRVTFADGSMQFTDAYVGRMYTTIPNVAFTDYDPSEYDPDYDIIVMSSVPTAIRCRLVSVTQGAVFCHMSFGIVISTRNTDIMLGQGEDFLELATELMVAMTDTPDS